MSTVHLATVVALLVLVAGCTPAGLARPTAEVPALERIGALLDEAEYTTSTRCLSTLDYDSVEVLDGNRLLFHGRGGRVWLNQLGVCSGFNPQATLMFEHRGSNLCRLDSVREYDPWFFAGRGGPLCSLGDFEEVAPEQAALLRDLLGN